MKYIDDMFAATIFQLSIRRLTLKMLCDTGCVVLLYIRMYTTK